MKTGQLADAVTRALWNLIVWSLFAGAICRIAAVQFARDQQIGMRRALAFAGTRFFGYVSAPLLPLVGVAILWALCVVGGWIGRIPGGVGEALLGILWGLELLFGFMMAVVLIGVAAGWPLMFATISVEGTDGFDGLSRAYNYVFERPLYLLWQVVVTMFYGSFMIFLVWLLGQILAQLTVWGVSWGMGYERTVEFAAGSPDIVSPAGTAWESPSAAWGAQIARGWMCLLGVVVTGFVHTFFWTSATIAYFLPAAQRRWQRIRRSVCRGSGRARRAAAPGRNGGDVRPGRALVPCGQSASPRCTAAGPGAASRSGPLITLSQPAYFREENSQTSGRPRNAVRRAVPESPSGSAESAVPARAR